MISKYLAAACVATMLVSSGAFAQSATKSDTTAAAHDGWRASKLSGVNVYNEQNDKIGDISDVILDKSGKALQVIIGVGGFLGMGEHLVAVPFEKLKWVNEPVRTSSTTDRPTNNPNARTDAPATTGTASTSTSRSNNWYPDHAVYSATKDELKQMPEFKY